MPNHVASFEATFTSTVLGLCCLMHLVGCGEQKQVIKDRATASGAVTFDGKPLTAGTIMFESTERYARSPAPVIDGKYSSDRVPVGHVLVTVETQTVKLNAPKLYVAIPEKYSMPKSSGLTADFQLGDNENVNFDLKP